MSLAKHKSLSPRIKPTGHSSPSFLGTLLCLVSLLSQFSAIGLARADVKPAGTREPLASKSIATLFPEETFPKQLSDLVRLVEQTPSSKKDQANATRSLSAVEESAQQLLQKLSRGLHDEIYALLGAAQEIAGFDEKAGSYYRKSLEIRSNNSSVLLRLAWTLERSKKCNQAIPILEEAVWRSKTSQHEILYLLGQCHAAMGNTAKGVEYTEKAVQQLPSYTPALRKLIDVQQKAMENEFNPKRRAELESQIASNLAKIVAQDPNDRASSLTLARFLFTHADPLIHTQKISQAENIANQFVTKSKYADAESVKLLFDIHTRQGKLAKAEEVLNLGLTANPELPLLLQAKRQLEILRGVESEESQANSQ